MIEEIYKELMGTGQKDIDKTIDLVNKIYILNKGLDYKCVKFINGEIRFVYNVKDDRSNPYFYCIGKIDLLDKLDFITF